MFFLRGDPGSPVRSVTPVPPVGTVGCPSSGRRTDHAPTRHPNKGEWFPVDINYTRHYFLDLYTNTRKLPTLLCGYCKLHRVTVNLQLIFQGRDEPTGDVGVYSGGRRDGTVGTTLVVECFLSPVCRWH